MFQTILLCLLAVLVVGVAIILLLAARKPDSFTVRRGIAIQAPPDRIFPLIADLKAWRSWSPWEKKDPDQRRTLSGAESGVGARYAWQGNKNVGQGSMEIVEADAPNRIGLRLDFVKPFEAHNHVVFTLQPQGPATEIVWTMTGPVPFPAKIMHVFMNMDRMVGADFEAGLKAMKVQAER